MFHACDLDAESVAAYTESMKLVKTIEQHAMHDLDRAAYCILTLDSLGVKPGQGTARRAMRDIVRAYAMMCPFFPNLSIHSIDELVHSEHGERIIDSLLLKPHHERSRRPNRRTHVSNKYMPKQFWEEWYELERKGEYPHHWSKITRPMIAKCRQAVAHSILFPVPALRLTSFVRSTVYKEGLVQPCYKPNTREAVPGQVICAREPGRDYDVYFDFTSVTRTAFGNKQVIVEPKDYPDLLARARSFQCTNKKARFALLRIWSSPYFWPLMLGHNNRDFTSFADNEGRCWEWKFVPKDMESSEWSIHYSLHSMLRKFPKQLGYEKMVLLRRDIILVMGNDEADLLKRVVGVTFTVQDRPWLREIDLWRSFINLDFADLENLDGWWFE